MGRTTITLDKRHFRAAVNQEARELGKTPDGYIASLIDAASLTFDEILAPQKAAGFKKGGVTEESSTMPGYGPAYNHPGLCGRRGGKLQRRPIGRASSSIATFA